MSQNLEQLLQSYANEINRHYDVFLKAEETAANAIFKIGELLIEVKKRLPHGEFIPWIKANCKFTRRHATRLMQIAERRDDFVEPPTSIRGAMEYLNYQDQMGHACPIYTAPLPAIPHWNPRGKLYAKVFELHKFLRQVREEGYDRYMVMEHERGTTAELLLRVAEELRQMKNDIDPNRSHIRKVNS